MSEKRNKKYSKDRLKDWKRWWEDVVKNMPDKKESSSDKINEYYDGNLKESDSE